MSERISPETETLGCGTPGCTDPNCQYGKDEDESYERGFKAGYEVASAGLAQTTQQWRPFHPNDWHNSTFCYPCVVIAPDGEVGTPCDPWTLPPDNDWTGWVCCPLPDDYASRLTVSDTSTGENTK